MKKILVAIVAILLMASSVQAATMILRWDQYDWSVCSGTNLTDSYFRLQASYDGGATWKDVPGGSRIDPTLSTYRYNETNIGALGMWKLAAVNQRGEGWSEPIQEWIIIVPPTPAGVAVDIGP